ncbi:MAG: S8 family serine peptidase, partial [Candidatus Eremiobacteraeota bacterium]|nr:S8 family serine peptidase [Candidatus Eremiobacteraeota bacterium]
MQITNRTPWESPTQYVGKLPTSGKGVGVVIMDEGFDLSHPDLKGNVVGVATSQGDTFESDPLGHGTHTLGVVGSTGNSSQGAIRGVAPNATLFAMKVKLAQGEGLADSIDSINRGMNWVVQNKDKFNIKVVNCSFVLPTLEQIDSKTGAIIPVDPLSYAINLAREAGITVVAGVGNFADKSPIATPAGNPDVIAVGALDTNGTPEDPTDDKVADFSSRGVSIHGAPKPDILAPGVSIMSA